MPTPPRLFDSHYNLLSMPATCITLLFIFFTPSSSSPEPPLPKGGLVIELIHRDSPSSPLHNPDATASNPWKFAYKRSRLKSSSLPQGRLTAPMFYERFLFFMKLSIGTPPHEIVGAVDTGSDLIWTPCLPCICYGQAGPVFDPSKSSTYATYTCDSEACHDLLIKSCTDDDACQYNVTYADGSECRGILSSDTFTVASTNGQTVSFPDVVFGCSHESRGLISGYGGIVGLSGGPSSLISQLGMKMGSWRFSYCLTPSWSKKKGDGHLYVGENAIFLGSSTPLAVEPSRMNVIFYYLKLEDVSVGSRRLHIPPGTFDKTANNTGGVIIDSGALLTELKREAFGMLVLELRKMIDLKPTESDSLGAVDDQLCFEGSFQDLASERNYIPILTFHFSGLDVPLHPMYSFIWVGENIICLGMKPTDDITVIGYHALQNMNVGYDLDKERLTMAPVDCSDY